MLLRWVSRKAQSACVFYIWSHSSGILSHDFRTETPPARIVRWNPQTLVNEQIVLMFASFKLISPPSVFSEVHVLREYCWMSPSCCTAIKMPVWHWNSLFYSDPPTSICKICIILAYLAKKVIMPLPWLSPLEHSTETCLRETLSDLDHKTGIFYFIVFHFSVLLFSRWAADKVNLSQAYETPLFFYHGSKKGNILSYPKHSCPRSFILTRIVLLEKFRKIFTTDVSHWFKQKYF